MATLTVAALLVAVFSVMEIVATGSSLLLGIGATVATVAFVWLTLRANRDYKNLLSGSVRRSIPVVAQALLPRPKPNEIAIDTWQPESLPKQTYLQTGAIEIVEMAEVVSIEAEKTNEEIANLDEILRRRRHVG